MPEWPEWYRTVPEYLHMIVDAWVEKNPEEATEVWHPGDAWWQIEQFAMGWLEGYRAASSDDIPLVRIRYKNLPDLHMNVAEKWWVREKDNWPNWELVDDSPK